MSKKIAIPALLLLTLVSVQCFAQRYWKIDQCSVNCYPTAGQLRRSVEFLSDTLLQGRARGTSAQSDAAFYIMRQFRKSKLKSFDGSYVKSFRVPETGSLGHNIVGMWSGAGTDHSGRYVIVGAHYDGIGTLGGVTYPGADANASGVAVMLSVAHLFCCQRMLGYLYNSNIIFVAFDSYMDGRAGAKALWDSIAGGSLKDPVSGNVIRPKDIAMMVDIDQVGSTLCPVKSGEKDFLMALGGESLPKETRDNLGRCNWFYYIDLHLYDSYYGSANFTKVFYNLGDRRHFIRHGVPTIYFTSGITDLTNTPQDTASTLDYDILRKRCILIFRFIEKAL